MLLIQAFAVVGPFVTTVGGTTKVNPEVAVDFSGGGFSNYFAQPSFQSAAVASFLKGFGTQDKGLFKYGTPPLSAYQVLLFGKLINMHISFSTVYQAGPIPMSLHRARVYVFPRCSACFTFLQMHELNPSSFLEFLLTVPSRDRWENRISERDKLQFTRQSSMRCLPQLRPLSISRVIDLFYNLHRHSRASSVC